MERMTSSGRLWALVVGILIAFALPKRVECGWPDNKCERIVGKRACSDYEVEPWGFYLLENVFHRNVGFAYSSGNSCDE